MRPEWTGALRGKMHNNGVSSKDIAEHLDVTKSYVSMILAGARSPKNAQERFERAYTEILTKKGRA